MPRNIESIVECHRAATERRRAGKPIWDHRIRIKHLFSSDDSDENAKRIGKKVAKILRGSSWWKEYESEEIHNEVELLADEIDEVDGTDHFNTVLDCIYDLADADRVWIG